MQQQSVQTSETNLQISATQIFCLKKTKDQKLDLTTDPLSPWHTTPEYIKIYFQRKSQKVFQLKPINHTFQKKYGQANICTKFFDEGQQYYTCQDCCKNGGGYIMCFCIPCWIPEKHEGHNFDKRTSWSNSAYCDCGWDDRIKPESFCNNHGSKQILKVDINIQQKEKFIKFFEPLIKIGLYIDKNHQKNDLSSTFWAKLSKMMIDLLESSLFYIRSFCEIMEKQIILQQTKTNYLEALFKSNINHQHLLFRLMSDKQTKLKMAKHLSKMMNNNLDISGYSSLVKDCFTQESILIQLAQIGIFIDKYQSKYIDIAKKDQKIGKDIIYKYHLHKKETLQKNSQGFIQFLTNFWRKQIKLNDISTDLIKLVLNNLLKSLQDDKKQIDKDQFNNKATYERNSLISEFILLSCNRKIDQVIKFYDKFNEYQIQQNLFDKFMLSAMKSSKKIVYKLDTPKDYRIMPILFLLIKNKNQDQLVKTLWDSLTLQNDSLREDFIETVDVIYHLISLINNYKNYLIGDSLEENDQEKQKWFRSYLYQRKNVDKDRLMRMRTRQNRLKFKNAGAILKQLCMYKEDTDSFEYISKNQYPNFQMKFKVRDRSDRGNFRSVPSVNFCLNDTLDISKDFEGRQILTLIFKHPNFTEQYCSKWWGKVKQYENDSSRTNFWKNYELSYHYNLILVSAKLMIEGENTLLNAQIDKIRNDSELFEKINSYNSSPTLLRRLIPQKVVIQTPKKIQQQEIEQGIENTPQKSEQMSSPQKQQKQQQIQEPKIQKKDSQIQRKAKFAKKKMEKYAKLKQKRANVLTKNISETSHHPEQKQQQDNYEECLLCHQKAKNKENQELIYLTQIDKDGILSTSFHGLNNKCDLLFTSCFHALHTKCYLNLDKRDLIYSCPLCTKKCNTILPCKSTNIQFIKKCQSVTNALFVIKFKDLNCPSLMQLLFKHLIESYGLNSLIYLPRYKLEKNSSRRMNEYAMKILQKLFQDSKIGNISPKFNKIYEKFLRSLEQCTSQLVGTVQKMIASLIKSKLQDGICLYDQKLISFIKQELDPEQFQVLKQSIEHLIGEQINIGEIAIQKMQEKQYKKLSFSVIKLPQTTQNFESFMDKPCQKCGKKRDVVCLISGKCFCASQKCQGIKQHLKDYKNNSMILKISSGRINTYKQNNKNHDDIYFDPFMMPYSDKSKGYENEIFQLNTRKFQKITSKFFGIK